MKMNVAPLISVILVNYNGLEDTIECVSSLLCLTYTNFEIIIVDNASADAQRLKENEFLNNHCRLIYADSNNGFSAGNNLGIQYAMSHNTDYVLLLNNDTTVKEDLLEQLLKPFEECGVGISTGNIYYYFDRRKLWYSNGEYNRKTGVTMMLHEESTKISSVTFICGCCMLISRAVVDEIGMLDEKYFLYSEDTAYCCKAIDAGWKLICNQDAEIYHKVSASTKANSALQNYYLIRNNLLLIKDVGTSKRYAFCRRIIHELKEIIRGRTKVSTLIAAIVDANRAVSGKSIRFKEGR